MKAKKYLKSQLVFLIIPGIMFAVGLIWPSFYWLCIGIITAAAVIINTIVCLIKKKYDNEFVGETGGCYLMAIVAFFTLAYWMYNEDRFVSSKGGKQHIYADCSSFKPKSKIKKVCELQGFLYGCFSDCKLCEQRKNEERQMEKRERERRREFAAQRQRQNMIIELQNAIEELEDGKSATSVANHLTNYFLDEEYIEIEVEEDDDVYIRGLPSRYQ